MDIQRLRNLTTRKLHTDISCVYEDLEWIIGEEGLMTHMLPRVLVSVEPWLKQNVTDPRFWEGIRDTTHVGTYELPTPTAEERSQMLSLFLEQPDPLLNRDVITVTV